MAQFIEELDVNTVLWQLTDEAIGKAAHLNVKHVDGNQITIFFDNGVHVSVCMEDDGRVSLTGWTKKSGDEPSFEFDIVDANGIAIESPLSK